MSFFLLDQHTDVAPLAPLFETQKILWSGVNLIFSLEPTEDTSSASPLNGLLCVF